MKEYKTTVGALADPLGEALGLQLQPEDPKPPKGDGWELVGSAVGDGRLFWFWARPMPSPSRTVGCAVTVSVPDGSTEEQVRAKLAAWFEDTAAGSCGRLTEEQNQQTIQGVT